MRIPNRYQIFDEPVIMPDEDVVRLSPYLSGWNHLINQLIVGVNESDVQRLIIMELLGKRRQPILHKLLVRYDRFQRERIEDRINQLLCKKS